MFTHICLYFYVIMLFMNNVKIMLVHCHYHYGPLASFRVHMASSAFTPAGYVHKSRGDNVVRIWVQLKMCIVCVSVKKRE